MLPGIIPDIKIPFNSAFTKYIIIRAAVLLSFCLFLIRQINKRLPQLKKVEEFVVDDQNIFHNW